MARDKAGQPNNVAYHILPAMLLNEVQRQHGQIAAQGAKLTAQQGEIEELPRSTPSTRGPEGRTPSGALI